MKFMIFDTSANGQPLNYNASARDSSNWPRMTHLAWQILNEKGQILDQANDLIKPQGFNLVDKFLERHKLTKSDVMENGINVKTAVNRFMDVLPDVDMVFSHNLAFNQGVVTSEADRHDIIERLSASDTYCLMQESTYYCGIPGKRGKFKWPTLPELHKRIFGKSYNNVSNAEADVNALARCFIVMYKTKVLEDIFD